MIKRRLILSCMLLAFVIFSCRKDKPQYKTSDAVTVDKYGVYVTNEGNFQFGNASVSYYDIANNSCNDDLYKTVNQSSLGDVCQSLCFFNNKAYIVVNNSGKIEVVDAQSFSRQATISGLTSPRYFLPVSNSKAYISDLYSNSISIVDLNSNTTTGHIPCKGWTEEMELLYGKAFITTPSNNKLYVVNTSTDKLEDSITIAFGSNSLKQDKNGKLWVLCSGDSSKHLNGALYRINPVNNSVEQSYQFNNSNQKPLRLRINALNDTLYFLNGNVYQMSINATNLPISSFITKGSKNFYGLGVDPKTNVVYVSDAIDYVQRGIVYRYQSNGSLINSFKAGIIPGDFFFR